MSAWPSARFPRRAALALALALFGGLSEAEAFVSYLTPSGAPQKWNLANPSRFVHENVVNRNTRAIRYFLAAEAYSSANRTAELNAARACFAQWQAVPGTIVRFEEGGLASGFLDVNTEDNTNLVYWAKSSTIVNGGLDNIRGVTGVTFSGFFDDGTISEADIVLNGASSGGYTWFTEYSDQVTQAQFVESILLHEIGHFLGLDHSPVGGATMFYVGGAGVSVQAGLAADDIAGVRSLYPSAGTPVTVGRLTGRITKSGSPVLGAIVSAEDSVGNLIVGTFSRTNGTYELAGVPPGNYKVRVTPLDPVNSSFPLLHGQNISSPFFAADPNFLPSADAPVSLTAGGTATLDVSVTSGAPPLRINRILPPSSSSLVVVVNYPVAVPGGATDVEVGVFCTVLPEPSATLRLTGDGLTFGPTSVRPDAFPGLNPPLHLVSVPVQIAPNATPGLRTLVLQQGTTVAYANGFIEIPPPYPDFNYDGLDDRFQRQYFPLWTAPDASPGSDPDHDGFNNTAEYQSGSNPTDPGSVMRVESVRLDAAGATVTWRSAPGRRYQVYSRPRVDSIRGWQPMGSPVTASGEQAQFLDPTASAVGLQFYRVQAVP